MSTTTIDLFAPAELAESAAGSSKNRHPDTAPARGIEGSNPSGSATEYPAREGESAGDVQDVGARVHPELSGQLPGTTSPAARGNESSVEQAVTMRGAEGGIATLPADAGCSCGGCGEWTKTVTGFGHCEHLPVWTTMSPRASCHFNPSRWVSISPEAKARRESQAAIDRAADDAESTVHGWSDRALEFIKSFAKSNSGKKFIAVEIVKASLQTDLPQPMSGEAWGRPLQQAARQQIIRRAGVSPEFKGVPLWEAP